MIDRIFGLISIPITLVMIYLLIRQVGKAQPVNPQSTMTSLIFAVFTLLVNLLFMKQANPGLFGPLLLIAGVFFGLVRGQATHLSVEDGALTARQSIIHLVFWGISAAVTQLLAAFAPARWVAGGLAMMFFSTGATLGTGFNLLMRQNKLRKEAQSAGRSQKPAAEEPSAYPTTLPK